MTARKLEPGRLVIASHNQGKVREIRALLEPYGIEPVSAGDLGLPEPEETGTSFAENALLKAHASAKAAGCVALADDSGLCVAALGGAPGVYTADWAERQWFEGAPGARLVHGDGQGRGTACASSAPTSTAAPISSARSRSPGPMAMRRCSKAASTDR